MNTSCPYAADGVFFVIECGIAHFLCTRPLRMLWVYSTFGDHPQPLGYPCAKFRFCCTPWRKIGYSNYSITHSVSHLLTQLIWYAENWSNMSISDDSRVPSRPVTNLIPLSMCSTHASLPSRSLTLGLRNWSAATAVTPFWATRLQPTASATVCHNSDPTTAGQLQLTNRSIISLSGTVFIKVPANVWNVLFVSNWTCVQNMLTMFPNVKRTCKHLNA